MRVVHSSEYTKVLCHDNPPYTRYKVVKEDVEQGDKDLSVIEFQNGPIKENGVNGCQNEDLINIIIDRLMSFQDGAFHCQENADAINLLETALERLNYRTKIRKLRGVEGTSKI